MSFRPPQSLSQPGFTNTGFNVLEYELQSERAAALGRQGLKVEAVIAELNAFDQSAGKAGDREELLYKAADVVWSFFIQREMCGFRNNREIIRRYAIPAEVLSKVGTVRK